eukprot:gnl/TRDRNA2_/TRDRNA2_144915_c1_seq1.p1 gnl/TRDRNA2_/TRDRNA2_144915_c1~~gnl/TRDRNA2_/TRDRNA2_144915_c1_seq1.p1  ORF type:complete len:387 (+),score=26.83 gnl/TRDRNA2_/TRDRNA2_144915_c1_seq1:2-1162(+)
MAKLSTRVSPWNVHKTLNTLGQVYHTLFVALAGVAALPFQCFTHPNGLKSVVSYPQVICDEGAHRGLATLAVVLIITFVAPFIACCFWGNYVARQASMSFLGPRRHFTRFRFLLYRFRPDVWWWGCPFLARQLLLIFSPMVSSDDPHGQIIYIVFTLAAYNVALGIFWPEKSHGLNITDSISTGFLIIVATASTCFIPASSGHGAYEILMVTWFAVGSVAGTVFVGYALYLVCLRGPHGEFGIGFPVNKTMTELTMEWHKVCELSTGIPLKVLEDMIRQMNSYDRETLDRAISCIQAIDPKNFWVSDKVQKRLLHIQNSTSARSFHLKSTIDTERALEDDPDIELKIQSEHESVTQEAVFEKTSTTEVHLPPPATSLIRLSLAKEP